MIEATPEQIENRKRWIAALRSGKYKQGTAQLRNSKDEFCCLGVLADISGLGEWRRIDANPLEYIADLSEAKGVDEHGYFYDAGQQGVSVVLSRKLANHVGLRTFMGLHFLKETNREDSLTSLNDNRVPFGEIAKVIEAEPEGLFY